MREKKGYGGMGKGWRRFSIMELRCRWFLLVCIILSATQSSASHHHSPKSSDAQLLNKTTLFPQTLLTKQHEFSKHLLKTQLILSVCFQQEQLDKKKKTKTKFTLDHKNLGQLKR